MADTLLNHSVSMLLKLGPPSIHSSLPTSKIAQQWIAFGALLSPDLHSLWKKEAKQKIVIQEIINRYCAEGYHFTVTTHLQPNSLKDTSASPALETWASRTMPDFTKGLGYKKEKKKCFLEILGPVELTYKKEIRITGNPISQTNETKHVGIKLVLVVIYFQKWYANIKNE